MKNSLVVLEITGKDIPRFIRSLYKRGIRFYRISTLKHIAHVTVSYSDYLILKEIPTIYEIRVIKYHGLARILEFLNIYKIFLFFIILGTCLLYFFSNLILEVEIVHDKQEIRSFLEEELSKYQVHKFSFIKNFSENEKIVSEILQNHRDKIEWLELERVGTKYIVKVTERKTIDKINDNNPRDVIARKKGTILSISASRGEVIKKVYDYVEAGDVIISGAIKNKDLIKDYVKADGQVFAETWYSVHVEVPYFYYEEVKTGKKNNSVSFKFLNFNKRFFSAFTDYQSKSLLSLSHIFLPISISLQEEEEVLKTEIIYTYDKALLKAKEVARLKLLDTLGSEDAIIYEKSLKNYEEDSKIIVDMFFKVKEDITTYMEITELDDKDIPKE